MEAGRTVKVEGKENDLPARIAADPDFHLTEEEIRASLEPSRYVGCAPYQTERYLREVIRPLLDQYKDLLGIDVSIEV